MKLESNTLVDIAEYCGSLIVTYLSDDKEDVRPLLDVLKEKGYEYIENEVGLHTIIKNAYLPNIQNHLRTCGRYVLFLSNHFKLPENRILRNNIFYQVGYLVARRQNVIVPYSNDPDATFALDGTPVHSSSVMRTVDKVLESLGSNSERYRTEILQNNFYEDQQMNLFTQDRIEHRRLVVSFDITEADFDAAYKKHLARKHQGTKQEFLNTLQYSMTCGGRILSFGTADKLTAHLFPYANEQTCKDTIDFPTTFACSHTFREDHERGDNLWGTYTIEYILPIHKLLGVNFKLFIEADTVTTRDILKILFASNFAEKHDLHENGNRLYFSLAFPNAKEFPFNHALNIGRVADYLYPR